MILAIGELEVGGTQRQMLELASHLEPRRYSPRVIVLSQSLAFVGEFNKVGIPVEIFPRSSRFDCALIARLKRYFQSENAQVVMTFGFTADSWCRIAARLARVPVIVSSVRTSSEEAPWMDVINRQLRRITDHFIGNSAAVASYLQTIGVSTEDYSVIPNGLNVSAIDQDKISRNQALGRMGIAENAFIVGMVSRLSPEKNVEGFLDLASIVSRTNRNVKFVIIGDGPDNIRLRELSNERGLEDRVVWLGARRDVTSLINGFDVAILTSKREGLSNTILEYMAASRPIVASNAGGNPELIADGQTGFLFPVDIAARGAECVMRLLGDESLRSKIGSNARATVEAKYSISLLVSRTQNLMDRLLELKGRNVARPQYEPETRQRPDDSVHAGRRAS